MAKLRIFEPDDQQRADLHRSARGLALTLVLGVAAMASFTIYADPYGLFRSLAGPAHGRPELGGHVRLQKAHRLAEVAPEVVVLGSSRSEVGIDPRHPLLTARGSTYNAALTNASLYEVRRMAEHAAAAGDVKLFVIGVDFLQFMRPGQTNGGWREARLAVGPEGQCQPLAPFADHGPALFSQSALLASRNSLGSRPDDYLQEWMVDGFGHAGLHRFVAHHGQRTAFLNKELGGLLVRLPEINAEPAVQVERWSAALSEFRRLLRVAHAEGAEVWCFVPPVHARMVELYHQIGLDDEWQAWRRDLVGVVAEESRPDWHPRLWDFAGYNTVTTEPVPRSEDERMRFYWEDSHFTPLVGGWMLQRMAHGSGDGPADFGIAINPINIQQHLVEESEERQAWIAGPHPDAREVRLVLDWLHAHAANRDLVIAAQESPQAVLVPWIDQRLAEGQP